MMQNTAFVDAKSYQRKHNRRKAWKNFVRVMACIVVFCTTYALILPAITMEKATFCGLEAHVHEEACYTQAASIVCDPTAGEDIIVLHTHDALCYQEDVLLCTLQEREGHLHTDDCYETIVTPAHTHDESCMTRERGTQLCQLEEIEGHTHGDTCFAPGINLQCAEEEREGHSHGEACYETQDVLNCAEAENPEHVHDETCYTQVSNLICEIQEDPGHSHTDQCYELIQICDQEEIEGHAHTDECFEMVETLGCGLEENPEEIVEKNLCCTMMELAPHTHSEGCFDENGQQICTILNATEHQHTEECIQVSQNEENLICEKEVHEHILECYSNPEADLETAADWEATFAQVERSGVWREDALTIAKTQLGYNESTKNYIVEKGDEIKGYTRYGAWYGIPYGDWCAMYASFCLHYAGVEGMPLDASCPNWISALSQLNLYHSEDTYIPVSGDLIFFDWNADADADHVGLVVELDGEKVKTIEGNNGDTVAYHDYELDDSRIMGYGALPVQVPEQEETGSWNCGMTAHTHGEGCYDQDKLTCQTSEHIHDEDCKNKQLFYSDDTLRAFVTIKGVEELPQDLSVRVWQISSEEDPENVAAMQAALIDQLATDTLYIKESVFYGMELLSEGGIYELPENGEIAVRVEFEEPLFAAEEIEDSVQVGTYQMVSAEPVSTFALRDEEEQTGEVYQAETVNGEAYDNTDDGLMALGFRSETVSTFAVALASELTEGIYWERVYKTSDITSGGTYMIVSAEGSYALSGGNTNYQAVTYQAVTGTPEGGSEDKTYYTITNNNNANLRWKITTSDTGYLIQNLANTNVYLYPSKDALFSASAADKAKINEFITEKCLRISGKDNYHLRNKGEGTFGRTSSADQDIKNNGQTIYSSRDMVIFKLSSVTKLAIPKEVAKESAGNTGSQVVPNKPDYTTAGASQELSNQKTGTAKVENGSVTVEGTHASDKATSNIEQFFHGKSLTESKANDGKIMTDKSVIYGADDYNAFKDYDPNTFGVTLSALGQNFEVKGNIDYRTPVDVVFILDVSGSMSHEIAKGITRADVLESAVNHSMAQILGDHAANRVGVVLYSSGAWKMLPLDRYTAKDNQYLAIETKTVTTDYNATASNKDVIKGGPDLKNSAGKPYAGYGGDMDQGFGTYTQAGIALGYETFADVEIEDTKYSPDGKQQITRQPVFILVSDGEPTHSTSNYADVLNGPHYGNGQSAGNDNGKGIHGYNTVLSANYYKRLAGSHYQKYALFYTVGLGIEETGDGDSGNATGDSYKRAVLNPNGSTTLSDTALNNSSHDTKDNTLLMLRDMINSNHSTHMVSTGNLWADPWYGVPHTNIPVVETNPYAGKYIYADGSYFGEMDEDELDSVFSAIFSSSAASKPYGFILHPSTEIELSDTIGLGMELKGAPVLRYNGVNYTSIGSNTAGNVTTYTYFTDANKAYTYPGSKRTVDLSQIKVTVTKTQIDEKQYQQTVKMVLPDTVLPTCTPESAHQTFYYEALPVRLIYQVGLTDAAVNEVLDLQKNGGQLTFYTNDWSADKSAKTELIPSTQNPFYKKTANDPELNQTTGKSANASETASYSVKTSAAPYSENAISVTHDLGNNGKLVFSVETVDVPVEKKWASVQADSQDPITVSLYTVTKPEGSDTYTGTLVEGKTLTLKADSDLNKNWKGMFEDLPKPAEGSYYAVAEAVPSGFVVAYEKEEIKFYVNSTPVRGALVRTYDENGVARLVTLTNSPEVTLPETGGPGTILYTTGGLLLMMAAFLLLLHNQKNKRRKEDIPSF